MPPDADSSYPVGKSIMYTCNNGYALVGNPVATCGEGFKWIMRPMDCQTFHFGPHLYSLETACLFPELEGGLSGDPVKPTYEIGEKIKLSCPTDMVLEGAALLLCEPSLRWSPNANDPQCRRKGMSRYTPWI
ncbi:hypothetical protein lerEdw1_014556 [Lerista edwardsae]|nr:hypothetical protein lerEdw1_014556 [Lerista edwardsae]